MLVGIRQQVQDVGWAVLQRHLGVLAQTHYLERGKAMSHKEMKTAHAHAVASTKNHPAADGPDRSCVQVIREWSVLTSAQKRNSASSVMVYLLKGYELRTKTQTTFQQVKQFIQDECLKNIVIILPRHVNRQNVYFVFHVFVYSVAVLLSVTKYAAQLTVFYRFIHSMTLCNIMNWFYPSVAKRARWRQHERSPNCCSAQNVLVLWLVWGTSLNKRNDFNKSLGYFSPSEALKAYDSFERFKIMCPVTSTHTDITL